MKQKVKYILSIIIIFNLLFFASRDTSATSQPSTYECPTLDDISFTS